MYHYDETSATPVSSYKPVRIDYPTYSRTFTYDRLQRVTCVTDILEAGVEQSTRYVYDANGNVIESRDKENRSTRYEYDALNRLVTVTDPLNNVTRRIYDDRGNLVELIDPNAGTTRYAYDRNNQLVRVTRPMGQETAYEYDGAGNRTAVTDAKGQRIEYAYDAVNKLTHALYYAADDHTTPVKTIAFTYNELGSLTSYNDGTTEGTYAYDDLQRKTSETINYGAFSKTIAYNYYANGLKQSFTSPEGTAYGYAYDAGNRLAGISIAGQGQITYNTYQWDSPTKVSLPGGCTTVFEYDPLMRVKAVIASDPAQNPVMTRGYTYTSGGNIESKATEHGTYTYQYDELYRLTSADNPTIPGEAYTYDALGNRLTSAATTGVWSYNANNELTGFDAVSFTYDEAGNQTSKTAGTTTTSYHYDIEDRLVRVEDGSDSSIAEYYYDPFGRRLWKEAGGSRTCFGYSDEGLIAEYDASGNQTREYGYAPGSTWSTNPLFIRQGGTYSWYQNDHQGRPQKIVTSSGAVVWSATYDSFGNCQVDASSTITNNLHGPGQYHDAETGLYYNLNRYYDPATGRYLSTDPIEDGLNLYAYCFNDPVNLMDPEGLCAIKWMRNQIHEILAAAGMIPVLGAVPDLLDSLIYAAEGDFYQAAFAIGCAVPGAGDALRGLQFASKGLKYADKSGALNTFKKLIMNNRGAIGDAKNITKSGIKTPYGIVKQSNNPAALAARTQVEEGATLYRLGTTGKSEAAEAQFWALEHPNTPGFAQRYGIPAKNIKNANFIEAAKVNPGTPFVTRPAPGIGSNTGGGIEVIVPEGGVHIEWFKH